MIDISGLSRDEKLDLLERLWDSLNEEHEDLPVPEWHLELVEERIAEQRRHPTPMRSAFDVIEELRQRLR
jgi:putative addiction module component (TIGR02574 family)